MNCAPTLPIAECLLPSLSCDGEQVGRVFFCDSFVDQGEFLSVR